MILPHFYPYVGGAETMFYELAKGMIERGHEVHVVAEKVDDEHNGVMNVDGIDVWYCKWKSAFGHPFPKKKDIEPQIEWCDVVHTSIFTTSPIVSKLAKKYNKPALLTVLKCAEISGSGLMLFTGQFFMMWWNSIAAVRSLMFTTRYPMQLKTTIRSTAGKRKMCAAYILPTIWAGKNSL